MPYLKILLRFFWALIFVVMSTRAAEYPYVVTGANSDGGWPEEKSSEVGQLQMLNTANFKTIAALHKQIALLKTPEVMKAMAPDDHLRLRFLKNRLNEFKQIHTQNIRLMYMCFNDASGWPKEWVITNSNGMLMLPEIKPEKLVDFLSSYEATDLALYGRVVAIQGKERVAVALRDRILPDEASLNAEWQAQMARLRKFGDIPSSTTATERLIRTVSFRSEAAFKALIGIEQIVTPRKTTATRSATPPSRSRLPADYDPVGDEFGGHSAAGYKDPRA